MEMILNRNLRIESDIQAEPVKRALAALKRDIEKTCLPDKDQAGWTLRLERGELPAECFRLEAERSARTLKLTAGDVMGFVYGIYEISRAFFGVKPFWFWNDQQFVRKRGYAIPEDYRYESKPFAVKLRGWFVNDEILIHKWKVNRRSEEPWKMVFEALLRCGGNMVIPGTDKNALKYRGLASAMGLAITHHHAGPLGADMFGRVYPDLTASYEEYPEKFQALWKKGIEDQKAYKVIWNLGFRGQGDRPFWEDDPRYQTDEARGRLMSSLIRLQYDMVKEEIPDAVCCTNLYGETMELYRDGYLDLPEDVIKIWADNGYGKMVSRRQMNHNPRIPALPSVEDHGRHGIYYHVSFYDLQAANQLTMCANSPEFIERELEDVLSHGADDYWIVNCSNVKPHVYYLDLVSEMWRNGKAVIPEQRSRYLSEYYGAENAQTVGRCLADYPKYAVQYGPNEDDHAGEQFVNHVPRMLVSQFMSDKDSPSEDMIWAADLPDLAGQVRWFRDLTREGAAGYRKFLEQCRRADTEIQEDPENYEEEGILFHPGEAPGPRRLFRDSVLLQVNTMYHCTLGSYLTCESILTAYEGDYKKAFYLAGKARDEFATANEDMRAREHGKWHGFYANDCQADIKQSAWVLESFMGHLRNLGDGPHFYLWQAEFLCPEEDRRILLLLNTDNHLRDLELYALMKEKWDK